MIASLKGLRNTRYLSDEVAQKVIQCATDKSAKSRVRVAAIEAFFADAGKPAVSYSLVQKIEQFATLYLNSNKYKQFVSFSAKELWFYCKKIIVISENGRKV